MYKLAKKFYLKYVKASASSKELDQLDNIKDFFTGLEEDYRSIEKTTTSYSQKTHAQSKVNYLKEINEQLSELPEIVDKYVNKINKDAFSSMTSEDVYNLKTLLLKDLPNKIYIEEFKNLVERLYDHDGGDYYQYNSFYKLKTAITIVIKENPVFGNFLEENSYEEEDNSYEEKEDDIHL